MRLIRANQDFLFAILTSLVILSSFPTLSWEYLAWIAFVPLLLALEGKGLWRAFALSYVTGLVHFFGITYWIWSVPDFNVIDFVLLAGYFPHYISLWGLGVALLRGRMGLPLALVAPPLWVTLEFVRSHFLSPPWMLIGHSQYEHPMLLQITSLTGAYGLSFLIVLVSAALAEVLIIAGRNAWRLSISKLPLASALSGGLLIIATLLYGGIILSHETEGESIRLALIQGNIAQNHKWEGQAKEEILDRYARLTRSAAEHRPSLIVWPETAVPGDLKHQPLLAEFVQRLAQETHTHLLVGSAENAKFSDRKLRGHYYNGMYLVSPDGKFVGEYRKIQLVPFGEYVPGKNWIVWPDAIASRMGDMAAGDDRTVFRIGNQMLATTICWDTFFPDLFREFLNNGARLMISSTNEAWFGETAAPYHALAMTTFRAAENRVAVARVANTGLSAFIDPFGRITQLLRSQEGNELFVEGYLVGDVVLAEGKTFYTIHGDVFAILQLCITAMLFGMLVLRRLNMLPLALRPKDGPCNVSS